MDNYTDYLNSRQQMLMQIFLQSQQNPFDALDHLRNFCPSATPLGGAYGGQNTPAPPISIPTAPPPQRSGSRLAGVLDVSQVTLPKMNTRKLDKDAFYADLTSEVIGQPQALGVLANLISLHIGKSKPSKPLTVLETGPTGTGKTLSAEIIPKLLTKRTGHDWGYIRVDLNQLTKSHDVSMLLGSTAGLVGYDDELLFQPLLKNKRQVILLDEMEKGHPDVLKVLMNAMGNGRLEARKFIDGQREFDFRECIMLFTSNLPLCIENPEGMTQAEISRECRRQLTEPGDSGPTMPPEIAARFTEILLFRNLSDENKVEILGLTVMRTAEQYNLSVRKIAPALMQGIVDRTSVERGAREAVTEVESILGESLKAFNEAYEGVGDIALSGTCEQVIVEPCLS